MSEFSISKKGFGFSSVLLQFLHFFFFFLLSHPLYFSYFIFFFPYFLKLLSFLSPLFITTFLLLLAFFSLFFSSDHHPLPQFPDSSSNMGFLATTYQVVFDTLRLRIPDETDEFRPMEELEAYKTVFETYTFGTEYNVVPEVEVKVDCEESVEKILDVDVDFEESVESFPEERSEEIEAKTEELEENKIEAKIEAKEEIRDYSTKAIENEMMKDLRKLTEESSISSRSESSPWSSPGSFSREYSSLGSYGSMRKEKEWRRTLACKLFEERHNSEGTEEGMDSLWETYEKSESKKLQKKEKISGKSKRGKKIEDDEEDEDEDEQDREGQLCCLQALKFSAGKMNLGMGRPNLVKMSKALKGFGWLNRNGSRKRLIL